MGSGEATTWHDLHRFPINNLSEKHISTHKPLSYNLFQWSAPPFLGPEWFHPRYIIFVINSMYIH